jgi:sugar phosphate isomerase/epimerase
MRLGIFAKVFHEPTVLECLVAAHQAGFATVQFNMQCAGLPSLPDLVSPAQSAEIVSAARTANVSLAALSGTYNMIHPDLTARTDGRRRLTVAIATAATIGAPLVTLCTGTRDPHDQWRFHPDNVTNEAWRDLREEMVFAARTAEEHGILLGIEPESGNVVRDATTARRLIHEIGSERLRVVFDPANLFEVASLDRQRSIVSSALDLLAENIAIAHAKDRRADGAVVAAGEGVLDYEHFLRQLRATGFDGPLIAHEVSATDAARIARFLGDALKAVA